MRKPTPIKHTYYAGHLLIIVSIFYILASLLAIFVFNIQTSVFAHGGTSVLKGGDNSSLNATLITGDVDREPDKQELFPEEEPEPEVYPEPEEEPESEPEPEVIQRYYTFVTTNHDTILNVREKPTENSKSLYRLKPRTEGYIMELGDEWSYVYVPSYKAKGYCSNEYLSMTEIPEEAYPPELLSEEPLEEEDTGESTPAAGTPAEASPAPAPVQPLPANNEAAPAPAQEPPADTQVPPADAGSSPATEQD